MIFLYWSCALKSHWMSLLDLIVFSADSLVVPLYKIMSIASRDSFTSSVQVRMPFVSFSWLLVLARTSSAMLIRSLVPDHGGKALIPSWLNMMLAVCISMMSFIRLRKFSSVPCLGCVCVCFQERCWMLPDFFFWVLQQSYSLFFILLIRLIILIDFQMLNPVLLG